MLCFVSSVLVIPSYNVSDVCSLFFIQYGNIFYCFKFDKFLNTFLLLQGWCSGDNFTHHYRLGSNPGDDAMFGLASLLLVLSLAPRGFSPGTPVSRSLKTNISKF